MDWISVVCYSERPARYCGGRDIGPRRGVIEMKGPARLYQRAVPGIDPGHRDHTLIGGGESGRRGGTVIADGGDDAGAARQHFLDDPGHERIGGADEADAHPGDVARGPERTEERRGGEEGVRRG